jgi:hypothetical protein
MKMLTDGNRPLLVCEVEGKAPDIQFGELIRVARCPIVAMSRRTS